MEMADGIAITKSDGSNIDKAKSARAQYANAVHLFPPTESGWIPEVKTCSAIENKGIDEVYEMIEKFVRHTKTKNFFNKKRRQQTLSWFDAMVHQKIKNTFFSDSSFVKRYNDAKENIEKNNTGILNALDFVFSKK